jgi:hypothetical protein
MALYEAITTVKVYIWGNYPPHPDDVANAIEQEIEYGSENFIKPMISKVNSIAEVPSDWHDAIPYGERSGRTIKKLLESDCPSH